jgi:hypothetical protein
MVSETGLVPLPKHVAALQDFPPPTDVKQLQQFLGLINFYRRFLPSIARTLKPLTDLLKGNPKVLLWPSEAAAAFLAAKSALVAAVPLSHPAPNATLSLAVDASDSHVGGGPPAVGRQGLEAAGLLFAQTVVSGVQVLHLRQGTAGGVLCSPAFPFPVGGPSFSPPHRP